MSGNTWLKYKWATNTTNKTQWLGTEAQNTGIIQRKNLISADTNGALNETCNGVDYKERSGGLWCLGKNYQKGDQCSIIYKFDDRAIGIATIEALETTNEYPVEMNFQTGSATFSNNLFSFIDTGFSAIESVLLPNWSLQKFLGIGATRNIGLAARPIGYVYLSVDKTDPQQLFGGTWKMLEAGQTFRHVADLSRVEQKLKGALPTVYGSTSYYATLGAPGDVVGMRNVNLPSNLANIRETSGNLTFIGGFFWEEHISPAYFRITPALPSCRFSMRQGTMIPGGEPNKYGEYPSIYTPTERTIPTGITVYAWVRIA